MTQTLLNGYNFKLKYPNKKFYKLTNQEESHRGYKYSDGLNTDNNMFD